MRVEIMGGPRDGEVLEVPDGVRSLTFPAASVNARGSERPDPADQFFPTFEVPIERVGRDFRLRWPKNG